MTASAKRDFRNQPLLALIDRELGTNTELKDGCSAYVSIIDAWRRSKDDGALVEDMIDFAAWRYRQAGNAQAGLFEFDDGSTDFLFDMGHERVVAAWARSRSVAANSRDNAYHAGFPSAGAGHDKGHLMGHAQGGREGGPNYIRQARRLNQARSNNGKLWRAIETYLAANAGLFALVRLIYAKGDTGTTPSHIEYCLFSAEGQFRAVIFPNS